MLNGAAAILLFLAQLASSSSPPISADIGAAVAAIATAAVAAQGVETAVSAADGDDD